MAIKLKSGKIIEIIDSSLPEIYAMTPHGDRFQVLCFLKLLQKLGVDCFEANVKVFKELGSFAAGIKTLFRIQEPGDVEPFLASGAQECILRASVLSEPLFDRLFWARRKITLEIPCPGGVLEGESRLERLPLHQVHCLRLSGVSCLKEPDSMEKLLIKAGTLVPKVEVVASDRLYMAGSIALEACRNGVDRVGVAFGGYGQAGGYAPLEELLVSLIVLGEAEGECSLEELPSMVKLYKSLSGYTVSSKKPVIGSRIFRVESGIHTDGIHKSPETYEPFSPEMVGLSRELVLGKHSGSRTIIMKLAERGIECSREEAEAILARVRSLSIEYGRELSDDELEALYRRLSGEEVLESHV